MSSAAAQRTYTHLMLTRHGETSWHEDNRYAGADSDVDLTDFGRQQAEQLADWARRRRPFAVVSSPVRRAVETATPCAQAIGTRLHIVDDLREVTFGIADGHTLDELARRDPQMVDRFRADPVDHPFPGAEPPRAAARRVTAALRLVADTYAGSTVLVVAHNTVLRLGLCVLLDLPIERYRQLFASLRTTAISELRVPLGDSRPASLLSLNVPVAQPP
jgi:2,3-bisphosphoglycerate-dependent phosphoglycerate mutase